MLVKKYINLLNEIQTASPKDSKSICRLGEVLNSAVDNDPFLAGRLSVIFKGEGPHSNDLLFSDEIKDVVSGAIEDIEVKVCKLSDKSSISCITGLVLLMDGEPSDERNLMVIAISELLEDRARSGDYIALAYIGSTHVAVQRAFNDKEYGQFLDDYILHPKPETSLHKVEKHPIIPVLEVKPKRERKARKTKKSKK